MRALPLALVAVSTVLAAACSTGLARTPPGGAVAADHVLASQAGTAMLRLGGNAVDAAVAAALSSGVVQPAGSGLGGGGFALVVDAHGRSTFLDFRETAPAAATHEMYLAPGTSSRTGGLAVATPAEGIGLAELHRRFGRLTPAQVAAPAIAQARDGFAEGAHLHEALQGHGPIQALFVRTATRMLQRPQLANALQAWADTDGRAFRDGWVARDFVHAVQAAGGVLTLDDLRSYRVRQRTPLTGTWHGYTVVTAPPPSSGGIAVLQMLEATDGVEGVPCRVEAAKHAMADRAAFGGDPDHVRVDPEALLAPAHIAAIRSDCGPRTFPPEHYGTIAAPADHGTLHISAMDADGMAVALTSTINTSFGSEVVSPATGIVLNNEMDDFMTQPGKPNAFGLVQGESNAVGPGRRPLSSMSPTVVLGADHRPVLSVGASGGPFIITATYQVIENALLGGMDLAAAVSAPRWHHQWLPDQVTVERGETRSDALTAAGHTLKTIDAPFCAVQAVRRLPDGRFDAASDPRKSGEAAILP